VQVAEAPPAQPVDSTPVAPPVQVEEPAPQPERRPEPREREKAEEANRSAQVIIDGRLPAGWSRSVNGGASSSEGVVELRPRRASTIVVDAPGFCTETRTFQLSPGEEYRWVLSMRERP
jgi:outer membrane biosynthesis protein TonB